MQRVFYFSTDTISHQDVIKSENFWPQVVLDFLVFRAERPSPATSSLQPTLAQVHHCPFLGKKISPFQIDPVFKIIIQGRKEMAVEQNPKVQVI